MNKTIYSKKYKEIISRLSKAREALKLTQADVASALGKPQSYISKIERCERRLDIAELIELSKIYKKDPKYFFEI
ncbi:hypothetical protein COU74_03035 [Candidatus Peregrinibacteria bacterium CG10_big_fil_rev_8_21_14_0_10_36_19]|nr:MAG: hypothetical protein COU74_03035 [Candidatus Peregrinibacteria bacterium CG10_big_fil_rev_8_21_14_0_10_36_19]